MRVEQGFQQTPHALLHPYTDDLVLPSLLKRLLPDGVLQDVEADLVQFGNQVNGPIRSLAALADPPHPSPSVTQYDQWGRRVDILHTSEGWRALKAVAAREGLVSIFYERKHREYSRIYGFAKSMLWQAESRTVPCPLSMTDGCARVIELMGTDDMRRNLYPRLISRDPSLAFTAGQFMTERPGGSDVSQTETVATPVGQEKTAPGSPYLLDGFKWFSSATDGQVALALARTGPPEGGSRSLSLFLLPMRLPLPDSPTTLTSGSDATSNGVLIHRLKQKIGTHPLPTAELSLNSSLAYLVGPLNQGVKSITPVLNITRIHSAIASVGNLQRALAIARSFAQVRRVEGGKRLLKDVPLHTATLAKVALTYRALTHLVFGEIALLGRSECGVATQEEEVRLRILTPTVKAFAAHLSATAMEECMAALGGQGYMEENDIGRLIRDGLVEKIWEGTVNVLALDLVRATQKDNAIKTFVQWCDRVLASVPQGIASQAQGALRKTKESIALVSSLFSAPLVPTMPRLALLLVAYVASSIYLLEHALWAAERKESTASVDLEAFIRWTEEGGIDEARRDIEKIRGEGKGRLEMDSALVFGTVKQSKL